MSIYKKLMQINELKNKIEKRKKMKNIIFKILDEVCTPKRGTKYSAYVDLFAREDITIGAGETKIVKLGVKIDLDKLAKTLYDVSYSYILKAHNKALQEDFHNFLKKHYLEVALRSSLGVKGLIIANGIGIIDLDYPDEIGLIVHNPHHYLENDFWFHIGNGISSSLPIPQPFKEDFKISKGDKVAQCTLKEHKGYLMGYETETLRTGGFGSTDKKEEALIFDKKKQYKSWSLSLKK